MLSEGKHHAEKIMKEKFIQLLTDNGIDAEMGITPISEVYIMHLENDGQTRDFWFVETEGDIDTETTNFIRRNIEEYIFACVKNEDYENGKYMIGKVKELSGYGTPDGIKEDVSFMTMSFAELVNELK